jgi:hypothetical protein
MHKSGELGEMLTEAGAKREESATEEDGGKAA